MKASLDRIIVRTVHVGDCDDLLALRNAENMRKFFRNTEKVSRAEHLRWFNEKIKSSDRERFFVAEIGQRVVGYVRYDRKDGCYNISLGVDGRFRRQSIGSLLMKTSLPKVEKDQKPIVAIVKKDNTPSLKFFSSHGFICKGERKQFLTFVFQGARK